MRKLLLTALLGLMVVACNKDYETNVEPTAQELENVELTEKPDSSAVEDYVLNELIPSLNQDPSAARNNTRVEALRFGAEIYRYHSQYQGDIDIYLNSDNSSYVLKYNAFNYIIGSNNTGTFFGTTRHRPELNDGRGEIYEYIGYGGPYPYFLFKIYNPGDFVDLPINIERVTRVELSQTGHFTGHGEAGRLETIWYYEGGLDNPVIPFAPEMGGVGNIQTPQGIRVTTVDGSTYTMGRHNTYSLKYLSEHTALGIDEELDYVADEGTLNWEPNGPLPESLTEEDFFDLFDIYENIQRGEESTWNLCGIFNIDFRQQSNGEFLWEFSDTDSSAGVLGQLGSRFSLDDLLYLGSAIKTYYAPCEYAGLINLYEYETLTYIHWSLLNSGIESLPFYWLADGVAGSGIDLAYAINFTITDSDNYNIHEGGSFNSPLIQTSDGVQLANGAYLTTDEGLMKVSYGTSFEALLNQYLVARAHRDVTIDPSAELSIPELVEVPEQEPIEIVFTSDKQVAVQAMLDGARVQYTACLDKRISFNTIAPGGRVGNYVAFENCPDRSACSRNIADVRELTFIRSVADLDAVIEEHIGQYCGNSFAAVEYRLRQTGSARWYKCSYVYVDVSTVNGANPPLHFFDVYKDDRFIRRASAPIQWDALELNLRVATAENLYGSSVACD